MAGLVPDSWSVADRVIDPGSAGDLDADAIWGADGDFAGTHQPALLDAVLAGAGVGNDAGAAGFDGDQRGAERAADLELLARLEIDFGEDFTFLTDDRPVGQATLPENRDTGADQRGTAKDDQPVTRPDQGQPGFQGLAAGQRAVADQYPGALGEFPGQPFGDVNRAVLTAGAADGDRQGVAIVADVAGQPGGDEAGDIVAHVTNFLLGFEEGDDRLILAGQRAQIGVVVRVGQAAYIEDEVGIERNAMLEAEGLEHQRQALAWRSLDELADPFTQAVGFHAAGVDAMAEAGNGVEQLALGADGFDQRLVGRGQWVAAARLGIALEQRFLGRVQEQEGQVDARIGQSFHLGRQQVDAMSGAGINGARGFLDSFFLQHPDQHGQHDDRQVVDAV